MVGLLRPPKARPTRLVRLKEAGAAAPAAEAGAVYEPTIAFAVPPTEATPLGPTTADELERFAAAPPAGAVKVTTPPATGSAGLFAVTVTAKRLVNAAAVAVVCGVLPATGLRAKP